MTETEIFLDKYKQLEKAAESHFKLPQDGRAVSQLERMPRFRNERTMLSYARDVRNLISHNPKINGEDAVTPSAGMIEFLDKILRRIESPDKCSDIAITMGKLFYKGRSDKVYPAMETMEKRHFSHVPILNGGKVIGVFSKNTVFEIIMSGKTVDDLKNMTFSDISDYTRMDDTRSEEYVFVKNDILVEDAEELCEAHYKSGKRIGLIFLTENGTQDEKITAAVTPWTILGHKN